MKSRRAFTAALTVLLFVHKVALSFPTTAPTADPLPFPVVEIGGSPGEMGTAHGQKLASPIKLLHDRFLGKFIQGTTQRFLALAAASSFENRLLPEHRDEIDALARTVGIDAREAMLGQCFLDLTPMTACSTISLPASAAPDHVARFGRNLDFPSLNVADKYTTLFICRPQGRYRFAAVGWPGLIGVLSGMNERGLALANMEVSRGARLPMAMPYTLLYRTVLEQCQTVDEAIDLLRKTPRQTANNLMLMDASGDRAVAEITPQGVEVRLGDNHSALISTNHQRGQDAQTPGRCRRYDYLLRQSTGTFGQVDRAAVESMLAHVQQGRSTLQSMIFEPANRVLYLSVGQRAAQGEFHRVELKGYFGR